MAQLAIKGHSTRGSEIIEILEMLGGVNNKCLHGVTIGLYYFIDYKEICSCESVPDTYIIFTLEEFEEKFPYKVGDKVIYEDKIREITKMVWEWQTNTVAYKLDDKLYCNVINELQPYKEETAEKEVRDNWAKWDLPEGYEFQDKDGNVINTSIIKLVKKQSKYPKTYEECCRIIDYHLEGTTIIGYKKSLLENFQQLLICRDAYWKIAGEQIGLESWEPYWKNNSDKHFICYLKDELWMSNIRDCNRLLVFPTEKMRDAFYENFKELIEACKELL